MSGFLWLITEMLLLLTAAAAVFFSLGWRWRGRRALLQLSSLEQRLDEETEAARQARIELGTARNLAAQPDTARLQTELNEAHARQRLLERELLRLSDAKIAAERKLQAGDSSRQSDASKPTPALAIDSPPADDDLTRLSGAGRVMVKRLRQAGITRFDQVAALSDAELATLDAALKLGGRPLRHNWRGQARALHAETRGSTRQSE